MSHAATHWLATVPPAEMTHGEFRVLFHLCDCHNASMGCFPSQTYLRDHTGLSNGGLNKALGELERKGFLRRERDRDERTRRQKPTRYILGFELPEVQDPSPLSGAGADSTSDAVPSPLLEGSVSTGVESYINAEPVREPVKEPCAAGATHTGSVDFQEFQNEFFAAFPRIGNPDATIAELARALETGVDPELILSAAKAYADEQDGNRTQFIAMSENWLSAQRWATYQKPQTDAEKADVVLEGRAKAIREKQGWVVAVVSAHQAAEMVRRKLVTPEECRAMGLDL